jgi:hypothetical protein
MQHYVIVCQCITSRWFSPVSSINKTDIHDITEIFESGVKHHIPNPNPYYLYFHCFTCRSAVTEFMQNIQTFFFRNIFAY